MPNSKDLEYFNPSNKHYVNLLEETKSKISLTRIQITKVACQAQINLYWWIGQQVVEAQKKYGWGKSVVEQLSTDLRRIFQGTTSGFSPQNLWYMRKFYLEYKDHPNLQQLVGEIGWGQNIVIMSKIKALNAKEFYIKATRECGWTRNVLTIQIKSKAYERSLLEKKAHNFEKTLPVYLAEQANKTMKSVYMLDTLGLTQPILEAQLEERMVSRIKDVMLELGYGFAFIGNQYRIVSPSGTESFIDLLFYNRRLNCLVALELKAGRFKPEYAGKMNYYLNLLDDLVREDTENPSIGIILCATKNHIDVEYALRGLDKPVGVSEYQLTGSLPKELSNKLPDAKKIEAEILREFEASKEEDIDEV